MITSCFKRWLWFIALWCGGVLSVLVLASLIRWILAPA